MKQILFLIAFIWVALLVGCEKFDTPDSLAGTVWKSARGETDSGWYQYELTFTSNQVTYIHRTDYGSTGGVNTWEYTYDPPVITLERLVTDWGLDGEQYTQKSTGKIKGKTMSIEIWETLDVIVQIELKKQ